MNIFIEEDHKRLELRTIVGEISDMNRFVQRVILNTFWIETVFRRHHLGQFSVKVHNMSASCQFMQIIHILRQHGDIVPFL